uniref:Golgi SNAP receptor complex member 1 n=1 Tax=Caligus rogercresseyi TaxID=217165 RepID=C1BQU1_CALRO|nr:Golgi SNAP receptor complex member 1 [Caligus rogercresseyi]
MSSTNKGRGKDEPRWEDLRKEARRLENDIDSRLVSLSKMGSELGSTCSESSSYYKQDPPVSSNELIETKIRELESSLGRLSSLNESLSESASGSTGRHILSRHREILSDYQQEFRKTRSHIEGLFQRQNLLQGTFSSSTGYSESGQREEMECLLMENEAARNTDRLLDEQITIALESRETLYNQRATFKAMRKKLNDLSGRFPVINNLVHRINLRKKRDALILGSVIGLCLLFSIWYMFG